MSTILFDFVCQDGNRLGRDYWLIQSTDWRSMTSQEPKTKSKKSQKSPGKTCWCSSPLKRYKCWSVTGGAFLLETLVLQSLRTSPFYWRLRGRGSLNLENSLKVLRELLFLGSVLTVYQTATSKIITYLSWGEGLLLCSGIIFRGALASSSGGNWVENQNALFGGVSLVWKSSCLFSFM